ncbi:MAG: hypothetical protein K8R48_04440 [Alphaproteobacteria bacterium]|nr:hypothetical protein [Alphaproteobacteria bacterium]
MWGKKDEKKETPVVKASQSWDDKLAAALPQKASYYNAVRTNAYEDVNFAEFWVAMQIDPAQDKWRVMHYMIFDLDQPDGLFKSETVSKEDVSFPAAVYQLALLDRFKENIGTSKKLDLTPEKYPADKYPELHVHFFDIDHYKAAANIEGIAFDAVGHPYRRVEGKIFSDATFKRSEIAKSILAVEQNNEDPKIASKMESGILSDIFNSASKPNASLDDILKVGKSLACMDLFAAQIGAFYLGIQKVLGKNEKFDKIESLSLEDRKAVYQKSNGLLPSGGQLTISEILSEFLPQAKEQLEEAKQLGIHIEPFQKHLAECELYAHLLDASQNLKQLKESMLSVNGANANALVSIQESVKAAKDKFVQLGGTMENFDKLQAWVANDKKETIPAWVSTWLDRYYDQRQKAMKKVQERRAGVREVNTMSAKVKPPLTE